MLHQIIYNYIKGYLNIEIEGYFVERFINHCINNKILLWKIRREKESLIYANISIKDFKRIHKITQKTKCRIKIKDKKGIPFIFNKYKKRKIFFAFLILVLLGAIFLSNFIWNIEVVGNEKITKEEILALVESEGLKVGISKNEVNTKEIVNKMRLDRDDLAWAAIQIEGTNAIVKIVEADLKPEIIDEQEYCNIVATKPGIITKVSAVNGTPVVKEGDVVKQGSILVGGWLEGKYTGIRYVHANAEIQAKVWYSETIEVELEQIKKVETQNQENKYSVKINNFQINFYKTLSKFQKYDTIEQSEKLKLFSNFYIPIEIIKKTNKEYVEENITYTKDEAKQLAKDEAIKKLELQVQGKQITNTYINYKEEEQKITAEVIYEVLEEIGTKEKIVF